MKENIVLDIRTCSGNYEAYSFLHKILMEE